MDLPSNVPDLSAMSLADIAAAQAADADDTSFSSSI
jgi:hypothetical protein